MPPSVMMRGLPDKEPGCLSTIKKTGRFPLLSLANAQGIFENLLPSPISIVPRSRGMQRLGKEHVELSPKVMGTAAGTGLVLAPGWCPPCVHRAQGNASGHRSNGEGFSGEETKCSERAFTKREAPQGCPVSIPRWQPSPKLMRTHQCVVPKPGVALSIRCF